MQKPVPVSPRDCMLAAYEGRFSDRVPVAPEFWYYIPARVLDVPMVTLELEIPHWQALLQTFRHYQCEGWGIIAPPMPDHYSGYRTKTTKRISSTRFEEVTTMTAGERSLITRKVYTDREPSWTTERPVKDFMNDWPVYEQMTLVPPELLDWDAVQQALNIAAGDYLLEVFVGFPFIDFAGEPREGGLQQVILDLYDHELEMRALQERYIAYLRQFITIAFQSTTARSIFIASSWSSLSLLSPTLWRQWDKPVLEAAVDAAHQSGGLVHHHFHGRCRKVLPDLANLGLDCLCPFERPPGGDITDLAGTRQILAGKTTFNGNVHTVNTLIRGKPADVRMEVEEILHAFAGEPRLIVGTGDQVGVETPDENIYTMIETVRQWNS
ncbi:MAG: uroporphyrinogen decarboxylase family protein [Anaerolineae bacterium]|nr:uroporphyrinogen decarboxylase family protein [Anaerolineae bacterium]